MAEFRDRLNDIERQRTEATVYMIERFTPRFLTHVYTTTDRLQHSLWQYMDPSMQGYDATNPLRTAIEDTYKLADQQLARLWKAMGEEETTVLVMSDHGGGPLKRVLLLNNWLEGEGY
jgi:predicted AlkP superfamily phosphohydrolase/phosphomutase